MIEYVKNAKCKINFVYCLLLHYHLSLMPFCCLCYFKSVFFHTIQQIKVNFILLHHTLLI